MAPSQILKPEDSSTDSQGQPLNTRSETQADGQAHAKNPPPFHHTTLFSLGFCVSFVVQPASYFGTKIDPSLANLGIN